MRFKRYCEIKIAGLGAVSTVLLALFSSNVVANPQYEIVPISRVSGSIATIGVSLNSFGDVAGYSYMQDGGRRAFAVLNGVAATVETLGGTQNAAYGINDQKQITGWSTTSIAGEQRAFLYSPVLGASNLGTLGGAQSVGLGINNSGQVAGYSTTTLPYNNNYGAFVSTSGGITPVNLAPLPVRDSFAYAISDSGFIAGTLYSDNYQSGIAFLNNGSGTLTLGTLGGTASSATAVNNAGSVAGSSLTVDGSQHAFSFLGGSILDLGTIAGVNNIGYGLGASSWSGALGLNDAGTVVGTFGFQGYQGRGFVFSDGVMLDLNEIAFAQDDSPWEITDALGINGAGMIVAYGYMRGENIGTTLLLMPTAVPEPASIALFIVGLLFISGRIWRKGAYIRAARACRTDIR